MTKFSNLILLVIISISCAHTTENNKRPKLSEGFVDTSVIAILPYDTTTHWIFKESKQAVLTVKDIKMIDSLLSKCIDDYNPEQERQFQEINGKHPEYKLDKKHFIIDLSRYKRQYIAVTNKQGEKVVFINCFCGDLDKDSRNRLFIVNDGGNCFFNVMINLTTNKYYDLTVNGDA
jgi:hypothetical protein